MRYIRRLVIHELAPAKSLLILTLARCPFQEAVWKLLDAVYFAAQLVALRVLERRTVYAGVSAIRSIAKDLGEDWDPKIAAAWDVSSLDDVLVEAKTEWEKRMPRYRVRVDEQWMTVQAHDAGAAMKCLQDRGRVVVSCEAWKI